MCLVVYPPPLWNELVVGSFGSLHFGGLHFIVFLVMCAHKYTQIKVEIFIHLFVSLALCINIQLHFVIVSSNILPSLTTLFHLVFHAVFNIKHNSLSNGGGNECIISA